ncbi:DUF2442 domain-containing protein [Azospirillum formosense]|uniref:DUF2442 domain-containing protein n=1 Tax=Azospirillum formosense TaxID=861533 RepID=A0ABX2KX47_9PROT|nr:helix-turn-helix domain-containing protein [Azospirillum formosense]NUB18406.1 DUF2442 domain-containing protein [Azospirillum formosense]
MIPPTLPQGPRTVPRLTAVATAPGAVLLATWDDGRRDAVDLSGWLESGHPHFHRLRDPALFATAALADATTVEWGGDEDLAIDSLNLALLAEQQRPFGAAELAAWQQRLELSNQEAADLVGVHVNTWSNYRTATTPVPRVVAIACRAVVADPLLFAAHYRPRRPGRPPAAAE